MKILVLSPSPEDATSWYRAYGTFKDIRNRSDIEFTPYPEAYITIGKQKSICWSVFQMYDAAILQRSFGQDTLMHAKLMKENGIKLIYDLDDNLWEIPDTYKIKEHFTKEKLATIDEILKICDQVWVSTQAIADYIKGRLNIDCHVINNGIDFDRYPIEKFNPEGSTIWRGSSTHVEDLRKYREQMESLGNEEGIIYWGYNPVIERPFLKTANHVHLKPVDPSMYYNAMKEMQPKRVLVPLEESEFNRGKSNIAWLEATMSGGVVFSNQWGEFEGKGFLFHQTPTIKEMQELHEIEAYEAVINYNLREQNNKRIDLLKSL